MDFTFSIESYRLVRDLSSLSVREVSIVSELLSFASFLNDLNPGVNGDACDERHCYILSPKVFLSWFGILYFLGGDVVSYFIFLFFL